MQGIPFHHCHQQRPGGAHRRLCGLLHLLAPLTLLWSHRARADSKRGDAEQCSRAHGQHVRIHTRTPPTRLRKALKIRRKPNTSREGRGKKSVKDLAAVACLSYPIHSNPKLFMQLQNAHSSGVIKGFEFLQQSENRWIHLPNVALAQKFSERCTLSHREPDTSAAVLVAHHCSMVLREVKSSFPPQSWTD